MGYDAHLHGWASWPGGISWSANVGILGGWLALVTEKSLIATGLGIMSVLLALAAPGTYGVERSELAAGYFLWLASSVVLASASVVDAVTTSKPDAESPP